MKRGFTLTEVLVTLGVIGVIAAIMAPMVSNLIPDKNKGMVIKYYKIITDTNTDLLGNISLYYSDNSSWTGLDCTQQPMIAPYNGDANYAGATKYAYMLASKLQLSVEPEKAETGSNVTFTTIDGVEWIVEPYNTTGYSIMIDLNGEDTPNCYFVEDACEKPDRYYFTVAVNGAVTGRDQLTQAYLANPMRLNDRKKDVKKAPSYTTDLKTTDSEEE